MKGKQYTISAILVAVFALFAIYVWPTRYMYDHIGAVQGTSLPVRIDRFTGEAEWLMPNEGWQKIKTAPSPEFKDPFATTIPKSK